MAFKKRRPRDSQPQEVVGVDWNNPLLDGAEFVRLGSQIFWNPTNKSLTTVGALESRVTRQGLGQLLSSTQYQSYPAAVANGGTGPWTLAGLFMPVSGALPSQAVVGMAEAPNSSTFDRSIRLAAGTFEWQGYLYDGAAKNASTGVIPADGRVDLIITTTDTSTLVCSANGTEASIAVSSGGYAGYSSAEICIGRANNTWGGTFIVPLLVRTARYWSPAMRQSFWVNPWQLFAPQSIWVHVSAGGGPTPAGLATETDTSLALSALQIAATGASMETDAALALAPVQIAATGRADETDTAFALTPVQAQAVGLAAETDTALALSPIQILPVGLATEADSALALLSGASDSVGTAEEADTAIALSAVQISPVGLAIEGDTALSLSGVSIAATGAAAESDAAFALAAVQRLLAGIALEIDTALALSVGDAEEPTFTVPSRARIGGSPAASQAVRLGATAARTPGARIGQATARAETTRIGDPTP